MKIFVLSVLTLLVAFSPAFAKDLIGLIKHDSEIVGWIELREQSLEALALLSEVGVLPEGGSIEYVERGDYKTRSPDLLTSLSLTVGTHPANQEEQLVILGDIAGGQVTIESSGGKKTLRFQRYAIACF